MISDDNELVVKMYCAVKCLLSSVAYQINGEWYSVPQNDSDELCFFISFIIDVMSLSLVDIHGSLTYRRRVFVAPQTCAVSVMLANDPNF